MKDQPSLGIAIDISRHAGEPEVLYGWPTGALSVFYFRRFRHKGLYDLERIPLGEFGSSDELAAFAVKLKDAAAKAGGFRKLTRGEVEELKKSVSAGGA